MEGLAGSEVTVIIPTFNGGRVFEDCLQKLVMQSLAVKKILVIDSGSSDRTVEIAKQYNCQVEVIAKSNFGHGKTRQYALSQIDTEYAVFMTQDAVLRDKDSLGNLLTYIKESADVVAAYGRQIPYANSNVIALFARLYNYGEQSFITTLADKKKKGIKAAFLSDSFAIYKVDILKEIGGFPLHVNFGEDMYVAAKLLLAGYKTGYCADAQVYHVHEYSLTEEFYRSKAIGEFHKSEPWLIKEFGKPEGEGLKFVISEFKYLLNQGKLHYIPLAFLHNVSKFLGYKWGLK